MLRQLHHNQEGGISIFLLLCSIPALMLVAFVYNSGATATRRMEMQISADTGALAGATIVARGMNLTALNNNAMSQMLAMMIVVRSLRQTAEVMQPVLARAAAAVWWIPPLAAELKRESLAFGWLRRILKGIDDKLSEIGWQIQRALDWANQAIKVTFPVLAVKQTIKIAQVNSANAPPYALLFSGRKGLPLPSLPLARGPQKVLVDYAMDCPIGSLRWAAYGLLATTGPLGSALSILLYEGFTRYNAANLKGSRWTRTIGNYLRFVLTRPMKFPEHPPRAMILCDDASAKPTATTDKTEEQADFKLVRQQLQFLAVARGKPYSLLGGKNIEHAAGQFITYAQADCVSPINWSGFSQTWDVRLSHARQLNQYLNQLGSLTGLPIRDFSFLNTH